MASSSKAIILAAVSGMVKAISYQLTTIAMPYAAAAAALVVGGFARDMPWLYTITAASIIFGSTSVGIFFLFEMIGRRSIEGKLDVGVRFAKSMENGQISLGVNLSSRADMPIEFEIVDLATSLEGVYPPKKPFKKTVFTIPPRGTAYFNDHLIPSAELFADKTASGSITAKIAYGRPGRRRHELEFSNEVHVRENTATGNLAVDWHEAA